MLCFSVRSLIKFNSRVDHCLQDVHDRFRTESHSEATGRFNERFLLSLASCKACVVMDDELNVLPISSHIRSITPVPAKEVHPLLCIKQNISFALFFLWGFWIVLDFIVLEIHISSLCEISNTFPHAEDQTSRVWD